MQIYAMLVALVLAGVGQWFNRHPQVPAQVVKLALVGVGLVAYAFGYGPPAAWHGAPLLAWLEPAGLWAFAVPGAASVFGTLPGMGTNSQSTK